jgi:ectoine hydroxylase-related dioxygenase (phytanoyl-CoA dioxygenase family)
MSITITPEQKAFYLEHGYLSLAPMTDAAELATLRATCDHLISSGAGRKDGNQHDLTGAEKQTDASKESVPQLLHPSRYAPQLKETRAWDNALEVAMQLLDVSGYTKEQLVVRDHIIVKPSGSAKPTPWHQDEAYWKDDVSYNELSIWIALQDVNLDMGCMTFIPGSNKGDIHPHHPWQNNPNIIALEVDSGCFDEANAVPCPLPAGGATVHHCRTLHYTTGNRSASNPRRALILTIGTPPQPLATPRNHHWNQNRKAY